MPRKYLCQHTVNPIPFETNTIDIILKVPCSNRLKCPSHSAECLPLGFQTKLKLEKNVLYCSLVKWGTRTGSELLFPVHRHHIQNNFVNNSLFHTTACSPLYIHISALMTFAHISCCTGVANTPPPPLHPHTHI